METEYSTDTFTDSDPKPTDSSTGTNSVSTEYGSSRAYELEKHLFKRTSGETTKMRSGSL
jgi:hypothetical protein